MIVKKQFFRHKIQSIYDKNPDFNQIDMYFIVRTYNLLIYKKGQSSQSLLCFFHE